MNVDSDWEVAMRGLYARLINIDQMSLSASYLQELLLWLQVTGLYRTPSTQPAPEDDPEYSKWSDVEAVYVTLQILRAALGFFTSSPFERRGIPCLCCTVEASKESLTNGQTSSLASRPPLVPLSRGQQTMKFSLLKVRSVGRARSLWLCRSSPQYRC